jgi:RHS repeat-associated protein
LWYHHDQLGSTRLVTNSSGVSQATYTYDPYGGLASSTGSITNPFRFCGQYQDSESSFYYLRARYYDPVTAEFISKDRASNVTRQPYQYVNGSPLNGIDPAGLWGFGVGYGITAFIGIGKWGIGFTASVQVVYTSDGSVSLIDSFGGAAGEGVAAGAYAGAGFNGFYSPDARTINDLAGPFTTTGIGGGLGDAIELQVSQGSTASEVGASVPFIPCGIGGGYGAVNIPTYTHVIGTKKLW